MSTLLVAARAIHYTSAMLLFGELVFAIAVTSSGWRNIGPRDAAHSARIYAVTGWSIVAGFASGAAWFVVEAAVMSGMPLASAIDRETLGVVLYDTSFGRVWALRGGLLVALCVVGVAMRRSTSATRRSALCSIGALVAAGYLGTLAWAGHAAGGEGDNDVQMIADVVHLLAAGAWLGSLPALVDVLGATRPVDVATRAARRFSTLGLLCVTALVASGLVNAWYQVGTVPALLGTLYGRLLLAKLALFATIIGVVIVNRGVLAPRVADGNPGARSALRRNALIEVVLGLAVVIVVSRLGVTIPAAHQPSLWPFRYTLSTLPMEQSAWIQLTLAAAGLIACVAAIAMLTGVLRRPPRVRLGALVAIIVPAGLFAWLLAVPAHPTTYLTSPVGYTTSAIAAGAALYAANCGECHGRDRRGDGPGALPLRPKDLAEQPRERREGDLFWSIAQGMPGTSMPGFASRLTDVEIWNLLEFFIAQSAARNASAMAERAKPLVAIPAPDFPYELIGRPQETLHATRGDRVTLLMLYTLPQSLPRLVDIATNLRAYTKAGARVIAVSMDGASSSSNMLDLPAGSGSMLATAGNDVAAAYLLFAQPHAGLGEWPPAHVEYLIDRQGELRVRWMGVPDRATDRSPETLVQIEVLSRELPRPPREWWHRH